MWKLTTNGQHIFYDYFAQFILFSWFMRWLEMVRVPRGCSSFLKTAPAPVGRFLRSPAQAQRVLQPRRRAICFCHCSGPSLPDRLQLGFEKRLVDEPDPVRGLRNRPANSSPAIGMVGPMSNYAAPPQLVETVPYRVGPMKGSRFYGNLRSSEVLVNVDEVQTFGKEFRESHKGKWVPVDRLGGFCLLLKRVVLTKIGIELEPWTDLSLFDTDILSSKARQAGFTLACCRDCFVHHFGTRTFAHGAAAVQNIPGR